MSGRKSYKKYTNETWTKRVDHEAGRHRPSLAATEPLQCKLCGDIYSGRRWTKPSATDAKVKSTTKALTTRRPMAAEGAKKSVSASLHTIQTVVCPACQRQRDGVPSGFVHLDGEFLTQHQEEVERLLKNEAERASEDNPLARIMKWDKDEKGRLMLATTTEHLAQRLGKSLQKAFKGKVRYDFSHENKLAHVYWSRD